MNKKLKKGLTTTMAAAMGLGVVIPAVPVIAAPATSGWVNTAAGWTYYKAGTKATGWVLDGGKWYFLDSNGIMKTGWVKDAGTWYYLTASGAMATGWFKDADGSWYFLKTSGAMAASTWVGNYYVGASGAMLAGTVTPDGWTVDASGAWDGHSKTADLKAATDAVVAAEASKSQADIDAAKALVAKLTVTADVTALTTRLNAIVTDLTVSSVTAINRDQIAVVFNQKVDQTTAEDATLYTLNGTVLSTGLGTDATAALQSDGKTVILTAGTTGGFKWSSTPGNCTLQTNTGYVLTIDGVKNADLTKTTSSLKTASFTYSDAVAPSVTSVTASAITSTKTVTVTFSEPVTGVGLYTINGKTATYTPPTTPTDTITLTSADDLVPGTVYSLQVINEKDAAGNLLATNPQVTSFNVTSDTAAPTVLSASPVGDNVVRVTFSKKMNATTLTATSNIKLLNVNGSDINGAGVTVAIAPTSGDTTGTQFDVTVSDTVPGSGAAKALFSSTTKTLPLTAVFTNSIKDSIGNAMTAVNQPLTLVLDQTAPAITSVQYVKVGATFDGLTRAKGAIVLTFNKALNSTAPTLATTDYTAVTDAGVDETATVGSLTGSFENNSSNKVLILEPATTALAGTDSETIRFNAGIFADSTLGANTSAAVVETVDLKNGLATSDTTAPVISTIGHSGDNITVDMGEAISGLDTTSVLNVANYRLNGAPMPSGTYVTVSGNVATLNVPAQSIATSTNYAVTVTGIKDAAGNIAATAVGNVALTDNVSPVLTSAAFNADGTLTLSFGESITAASATTAADYVVKVNGVTKTATTDYTVAAGVGADAGKVVLTFVTAAPVAGDVVSITTANSGIVAKDAANNTAKTAVTVSVTK